MLARHVLGDSYAHLQEHQTVEYSLWYEAPYTLCYLPLAWMRSRIQANGRQHIRSFITQAVFYSLMHL
jgi:hypothetical protein